MVLHGLKARYEFQEFSNVIKYRTYLKILQICVHVLSNHDIYPIESGSIFNKSPKFCYESNAHVFTMLLWMYDCFSKEKSHDVFLHIHKHNHMLSKSKCDFRKMTKSYQTKKISAHLFQDPFV